MRKNTKKTKNASNLIFKVLMVLSLVVVFSATSNGQIQDSTKKILQESNLKNTVKLNLTSWILYSNGVQMSYERVLSPKSSFAVFGGIIQFPMPSFIDNSSITLDKNKEKSGFAFGAEYRFYLSKENKYAAPHGVYLAPFVSYYHFNNVRNGKDTLNGNFLTLNTSVSFFNVGAELGYQFVIKKRFVVDCILFGPALSSYNFNVKLSGGSPGDYNEQVQAIIEALKNKFPLLKDISSDEGFNKNGVSDFWSLGFRYCIQIGYRF